MFSQKKISFLIVALVMTVILVGAQSSMADGAYITGEGHGYASYASTEIIPNGTFIRVVLMPSNVRPTLCKEIDQLWCTPLSSKWLRIVCGGVKI